MSTDLVDIFVSSFKHAIQLPGGGFVKRPLLGLVFAPDATCLMILTSIFQLLLHVVLYVAMLACCMLGVCNMYEIHVL